MRPVSLRRETGQPAQGNTLALLDRLEIGPGQQLQRHAGEVFGNFRPG